MKVFKLNENWDSVLGPLEPANYTHSSNSKSEQPWSASHYLINRDTENINKVKAFCNMFKMEPKVLAIYNYAKDMNIYPDKITDEELLYMTQDGCKVTIIIENGLVTTIKKEKSTYDRKKGFTREKIEECPFSMEKFNYFIKDQRSATS